MYNKINWITFKIKIICKWDNLGLSKSIVRGRHAPSSSISRCPSYKLTNSSRRRRRRSIIELKFWGSRCSCHKTRVWFDFLWWFGMSIELKLSRTSRVYRPSVSLSNSIYDDDKGNDLVMIKMVILEFSGTSWRQNHRQIVFFNLPLRYTSHCQRIRQLAGLFVSHEHNGRENRNLYP